MEAVEKWYWSDQTVIQMKMTCSPLQKPLPKPEKINRTPTLDQNMVTHSLQVSGVVCPCSRAKRDSVTKLIEIQGPPRNSNVCIIMFCEDILYPTHTLKNKVRHIHEKYDTLMASVTHFRGQRHIKIESDTQGGSKTL